jgi:cobalt/nickel transport system permease protein
MHIPDGFVGAPVSVAAGAVSVAGIAYSLKRAKDTLQERAAPLAGLVAAFIFAVQMLNFPVAAGTSGHLLGGLLAAVLVGPYAGSICVAVVLVVQALFFADGGLSALGLNVLNMALISTFCGYALFLGARRVLPADRTGVMVAAGIAGAVSVVAASLGFTFEYALGGTGTAPVTTVGAAMVGVHVLIGIGEAIITALTVGVVLGVRPDLVHGAKDVRPDLQIRPAAAAR